MSSPKPPAGLRTTGRRLWTSVQSDFELSEPETAVLREACRTADSIDSLQAVIDADGPMAESSQGIRVHPALVELRQQRIALARLFTAMSIPVGEDAPIGRDAGGRTQKRGGVRGVYGIRGTA